MQEDLGAGQMLRPLGHGVEGPKYMLCSSRECPPQNSPPPGGQVILRQTPCPTSIRSITRYSGIADADPCTKVRGGGGLQQSGGAVST